MWSTNKPNAPQAMAPEPKGSSTDKRATNTMRPSDSTPEQDTGWLGSSLCVKGDITGTQDLLIDGSVEGLIELEERKLTVGPTARLTADVNAGDVVVHGHVKGNVRAKGRIEIRKGGSIIGNLTTAQIMIEDGADFKGSIEIDRTATKRADTDVPERAASAAAGQL